MVGLLARAAALALALGTLAAPAAAAPTILTRDIVDRLLPTVLVERPASIAYSGDDTSRQVAGSHLGFAPNGGPAFGPLTWTTYTDVEARAAGIAFVSDCVPSCEDGTFVSVPASVRAFAPADGHFTRLDVTYRYDGRTLVERARVQHVPDDPDGRPAHWNYETLRPRTRRCGSVPFAGLEGRGRVRVGLTDVTCRRARRIARRAASRPFSIGDILPSPRGWACETGFRPTVDNPRPDAILCHRPGPASRFADSIRYGYRIIVRYPRH